MFYEVTGIETEVMCVTGADVMKLFFLDIHLSHVSLGPGHEVQKIFALPSDQWRCLAHFISFYSSLLFFCAPMSLQSCCKERVGGVEVLMGIFCD
jgi:hypothetical protein